MIDKIAIVDNIIEDITNGRYTSMKRVLNTDGTITYIFFMGNGVKAAFTENNGVYINLCKNDPNDYGMSYEDAEKMYSQYKVQKAEERFQRAKDYLNMVKDNM